MKIGFHVGQVVLRGADLHQQYLDHLEQFRAARDAGFAYFSWGHHWLIHPFQHFQPLPMLARFAAEAGTMELMTMLLLTPLLNPVALAEEIATLDHICGGRFIFGAGLGYRPEECEAAGITMAERAARFEEGLHLMKRLWTEDEVTHHGRFYRVTAARPTARCFQRPYPRIWLAGMTAAAVKRAGRLGHPFIPSGLQSRDQVRAQLELWRASLAENGHQPGPDQPILREFYLAPTRDAALWEARGAIAAKYSAYAEHGFPGTSERLAEGLDRLIEDSFIVGDPDDCVARLGEYEKLGFTHVALRLLWPEMEQRDVLRMIELCGAKVIPRLAKASSAGAQSG